jgi:amicyanin
MIKARAIALAAVLALAGAACGSSKPTSTSSQTPPPGGLKLRPVMILDSLKFDPETWNVSVGGTVTWTNGGTIPHTVTSDEEGGPLKSSTLNANDSYSAVFNTAGTYHYHCTIHPAMKGTVVVA